LFWDGEFLYIGPLDKCCVVRKQILSIFGLPRPYEAIYSGVDLCKWGLCLKLLWIVSQIILALSICVEISELFSTQNRLTCHKMLSHLWYFCGCYHVFKTRT
jgi:hypothetical protein